MALSEGDRAPAFSLPRDGGGKVSLAGFRGRKLALFFYPKADTTGCTREAQDFSRLAATFSRTGTDILGVSADPMPRQEAFKHKHTLNIALASDETGEMLAVYGVWAEKSMYGRTFMGIVRTTLLVDANGRIARIWSRVKVPGHAEEVLAAARGLKAG